MAEVFGLSISDVALNSIFRVMSDASPNAYEEGDFVAFYEGMGEQGHGVIKATTTNGYVVEYYFGGKPEGYDRTVGSSDMRGLSSLEEAAEYERDRGGK